MTEYTTLSDELSKLPKERRELIEARTSQLIYQRNIIKYLQEKLGLSEEELIDCIEQQSLPSNQEENWELNTLITIVKRLGGSLEITVKIPNKEPILISDS